MFSLVQMETNIENMISLCSFQPPVPANSWNGVLDATKLHPVCPQHNTGDFEIIGNEDCLYLNIYTPQVTFDFIHYTSKKLCNLCTLFINCEYFVYFQGPSSENHQLLPVMFYIHGGAFVVGSARSDWYEPDKLLDKNIVLVIPNYRIGNMPCT